MSTPGSGGSSRTCRWGTLGLGSASFDDQVFELSNVCAVSLRKCCCAGPQ